MKSVYFTQHAREQLKARNTTEAEVKWAIQCGKWRGAEKGRLRTSHSFSFMEKYFGHFYRTKKVEPVFVEQNTRIIVITVYTYFS